MAAFERSWLGRLVLSICIVAVLLAEVGTHLAPGPLARTFRPGATRLLNIAASEQTWEVFAPNPRQVSLKLEAHLTFADGTATVWHLPGGPVIGSNLRFYRWRKWLEYARADAESNLWDPTARWVASLYDDRSSPVIKVELVRRFHQNFALDPQPPWRSFTYYTLQLSESGA